VEKLVILGDELPLKISPNFLKQAACPRNLKLMYINKEVNRYVRANTVRGAAAHEAIAEVTRLALTTNRKLVDFSNDEIRDIVAKNTPSLAYAEIGNIYKWVLLWRDRFFITNHIVGHEEKMAIDEKFQECSWDKATYRGIVDYIDIDEDEGLIIDYKSQANILSESDLTNHEQLSFYCWLVNKFYPHVNHFRARIWYLQYGFYAETERTSADLAVFEQQMFLRIQAIRKIENWDPVPGEHCNFCDYIHLCPYATEEEILPTKVLSDTQALRLARGVRVKEEWVSKAKKQLKAFVDGNNDVELLGTNGSRYVFGYRMAPSYKYDFSIVKEVLVSAGIPLSDALRVDARDMKRIEKGLIRNNPLLADRLEEAKTRTGKTMFKGYIPKPGDDQEEEE